MSREVDRQQTANFRDTQSKITVNQADNAKFYNYWMIGLNKQINQQIYRMIGSFAVDIRCSKKHIYMQGFWAKKEWHKLSNFTHADLSVTKQNKLD